MKNGVNGQEFWITNITKMNISLTDLNLTIKPYSSVNLLSKHYYLTSEQLQKSAESGSIFKKRDKIVVRKVAPEVLQANVVLTSDTFIPNREKSIYSIKEEYYEELNISDEEFANENSELIT